MKATEVFETVTINTIKFSHRTFSGNNGISNKKHTANIFYKNGTKSQAVLAHAFNPSRREEETGGSL